MAKEAPLCPKCHIWLNLHAVNSANLGKRMALETKSLAEMVKTG
jgi:hypothetical protein